MIDYGLTGKVAVVTGGSHGIGLATAMALGKQGCRVILCGRTPEHVDQARVLLRGSGIKGSGLVADLTDSHQVDDFWDFARLEGRINILINNLGGGGTWGDGFLDTSLELMQQVMHKNLWLTSYFTQKFLLGAQGWGRVVTISSIYGKEVGGKPWFNAAKAAEIAFMKNLAHGHEYPWVTFNTVAPGHIAIEGKSFGTDPPSHSDWIGQPEDVAQTVLFLCSEQARFINGACLVVDGGASRSY